MERDRDHEDSCPYCGVPWGRHPSIAATCARLAEMTNEVADLSDRLRLASVEIDALKITLELQRMLDAKPKDKRRA